MSIQEDSQHVKDSESLDRCILTALSSLYLPFQATSSTVLCQVLNVVESFYGGDGHRCLIQFLLPAKQLLVNLQQNACVQHCGLLFRHEGWPLCIHEKVVVQLCPLDHRLLRPGDFYLLISPPAAVEVPPRAHRASCESVVGSCPRLLLCCLSAGSHHVEQQEVLEIALRSLFSMAWLDSVNRDRQQRGASRLERCLLYAQGDVFRVPWEDLVYPQFSSQPRTSPKDDKNSPVKDGDVAFSLSHNPSRDSDISTHDVKHLLSQTKSDQSPVSNKGEDLEDKYMELTDIPLPRFSPQKGSLTQFISLQLRARTSTHTLQNAPTASNAPQSVPENVPTASNVPENVPTASNSPHTAPSASSALQNTATASHTPQNAPQNVPTAPNAPENAPQNAPQNAPENAPENTPENAPQNVPENTPQNAPQNVLTASNTLQNTPTASKSPHNAPSASTALQNAPAALNTLQNAPSTSHTPQNASAVTNAPQHTPTLSHTPQNAPSTSHTPQNALAGKHTPTNTSGTTYFSCPEVSSHTRLSQEPSALFPTTMSPTSSSSSYFPAPSEGVGFRSGEEECWSQEEQIEGICSGRSVKRNTEYIEKEEKDVELMEERQVEREEEREVVEWVGGQKGKHEMFVSASEGEEREEQLVCQRANDLLLYTDTAEKEDEDTSEETAAGNGDDLDAELEEDGAKEEVEVEEEVQVRILHQIEGRRQDEQVMKVQEREGGSERGGVQTHTEENSHSCTNKHCLDPYCGKNSTKAGTEHSHIEKNQEQTHFEKNYCENKAPRTYCEGSGPAVMDPGSVWNEPAESAGEQEEDKKKKEIGGRGAAEFQTEVGVQSHVCLSAGPAAPPPMAQSAQSSFYTVLLRSGAVCLPGSRDRSGRALLTVCTRSSVWLNPECDVTQLLRLLLYYSSTLREEVRALGLTVVVDARGAATVPILFSSLRSLQENSQGSVHSVLLLVNKDSSLHVDKPTATKVEVLWSVQSLHKWVDLQHLPAHVGGSLSFSQSSWLSFRSRVEKLNAECENAIKQLKKTINILQATCLPAEAQDAELLLSRYKAVMRSILEDSRLMRLQQEGGASLSQLRSISVTEDQRAAVEAVSMLYDEVDELLHRLVTLSNRRTQELSFIMNFSSLEQSFAEVTLWLQEVGEVALKRLDEADDSLELLIKKQQDFKNFHTAAHERCEHGETLLRRLDHWADLSLADLPIYEFKVHSFCARLQDFSLRVKTTGQNIDKAVQLYRFLDQAYGWALEGMRHLAEISMEECTLPDKCKAVIGCLEEYHRQHPPIPDAHFEEMKAVAGELRGERGLRQWSLAWSKCQETRKVFDRKMEVALRTRDSAHRHRSDSALSRSSASVRKTLSGFWGGHETSSSACPPEEDTKIPSPPCNTSPTRPPGTSSPSPASSSPTPQHTPLLQRLFRTASIDKKPDRGEICSSSPGLPHCGSSASLTFPSVCSSFPFSSSRRQQLRKTKSFDCPSTPEVSRYGPLSRPFSEPVRRGNTGVFIRGLEVSSTEAADMTLCPRTGAHAWVGQGPPGSPRTTGSPAADPRPRGSKLRHIVDEMVTTEKEYVRSLSYIIHHYFPEMDRPDLPQDLRGKRSVVFGNLEKLLDFHSQFFLRELEACWKHPLRVPHCFLRHQEQFSLYALYSKNKPKSDALLLHHGTVFFRRKQLELGDKMDLSSYLLKPIQRMSKYALLLTDLMKEVGTAQEAELVSLQAATNMVKFQLRHGNDLLAMDAIRECDVNLKEQGQLIRQDEFSVWTGRRKCQRHIFLFEELVLFSKPKKMDGGLDVFIYKQSFKTADVGLTESTGDNGLRFEIWFRRRTSKNQTFILQANSEGVKHAWTTDIARILWTQATRNKELRLKEMLSMGVGNKPFLDIQPSDAAISDRAVHYIMKSRGARTRASIAVSAFDSNPFKLGAPPSDSASSGPSSSSLLGPLNLHMYSQMLPSEASCIVSCIDEDEQEHETGSQPSITTGSSGSSSRRLSCSTGSDSGFVSSHLQEALFEETKQRLGSHYTSAKAALAISPATIV